METPTSETPTTPKTVSVVDFTAFNSRSCKLFEDKTEEQIRAYLTNLCDSHILYSIVVYDITNKTKTQFKEPFEIKTGMPDKYIKHTQNDTDSKTDTDTSININTTEPRE